MHFQTARRHAIAGVAVVLVGTMLAVGGTPAAASPAATDIASSLSASSGPPAAQIQREIGAAQAALRNGEVKSVLTMNGYDLVAVKDASGQASVRAMAVINSTGGLASTFGPCTNIVAAGVAALGAALLAAAALTGGLTVAGVFLAPNVLNLLAAAGSSYAAIQSIIAQYAC